jgi:putative beta-lysine N-acetyltransferase
VRRSLPEDFSLARARPEDTDDLAALYDRVFATYPFPIHRPEFLKETMNDGTVYFLIRRKNKIVAASSAETDRRAGSVEMTDFATDPSCRGIGLSSVLLATMENAIREAGYRTAYTIARALEVPVNRLFAGAGYRYGGTLLNNTNIGGSFESMNVWYKKIQDDTPEG